MEESVIEATHGRGRKRKRQPETWKANRAKIDRYSSHSLPEGITCNHNSKRFACKSLRVQDLFNFHRAFYATSLKKNQDALILKCCSVIKIYRKRPTKNVRKGKEFNIKYAIHAKKQLIPVCKKVFLSTLGITKYRVQYVLKTFFTTGRLPNEKRGGDHKSQKYARQRQAVRSFVKSLKCVGAHYCRGSTTQRKYLPSELNIKKLYKMFMEKSPNCPVKQSYFRAIFNEDFNLGFGSPRTDMCSKCIEIQEKIKTETDQSKKNLLIIEKRVHKLKSQSFYKLLREKSDQLATFCFDCQKNLVLPKVPDQSCYYSRQLYLYNFSIIQGSSKDPLNKNTTFSYVWTEDEYAKGANQIASAVYDRLNRCNLTNITHLRLVSDGCAGQNKNLMMVSMCSRWILDHLQIKKVELVFPITGHSFMPADRVFGNIEKKIRKLEVITQPSEYIDVIREYATVTKLDEIDVFDWKTSIQNIVKAPAQLHFKISQCKRIIIRRSKNQDNVMIRGEFFYNSDTGAPKSICRTGKKAEMIQPMKIPKGVDVKPLKLRDVRNLLQKHYGENWMELRNLEYYKNVINIDEEIIQLLEENGEDETYDMEEDACERVEADVTLRV